MSNQREPEHLDIGDAVRVYPDTSDIFEGHVVGLSANHVLVEPSDSNTYGTHQWSRSKVFRLPTEERRTDTVEVPEDLKPGDAVLVKPSSSPPFEGTVLPRTGTFGHSYVRVEPSESGHHIMHWHRSQVTRLPAKGTTPDEITDETRRLLQKVEVPVHLLEDINKGGFSIQGEHRDRAGRAITELIKLIPDPDAPLRAQVKLLTGNCDLPIYKVNAIIDAVREHDNA